jgi:alpha-galactosidase
MLSVDIDRGHSILADCLPRVSLRHPRTGRAHLLEPRVVRHGPRDRPRPVLEGTGRWDDDGSQPAAGYRLQLRLRVRTTARALFLTLDVKNTGALPVAVDSLWPLHAAPLLQSAGADGGTAGDPTALSGWAAWIHGRQMTSDTLTHRFGAGERHETFAGEYVDRVGPAAHWRSHGMAVFGSAARRVSLLLGFVTQGRQFTEIAWGTDGDEAALDWLGARCDLEGQVLAPGATVASETLMIACGDDPVALADRYARETARRMKARVPRRVPTGWCSWYYFYNRVTEADVRANLDALARLPYRLDYVQIDDGYQSATGDWLVPNDKFPGGMEPLARAIASAGFRPGLWLAPFAVNRDARLFAEHPEWLLHDAEGRVILHDIWLGPCAGLDCTHPGAQDWLRRLFRTVVHGWGYTFLKLDALFCACYAGARHHEPGTTTAANLRRGLEVIREAAGDEAFILGCSCPFGPAVGLVDAMRVGPDVEARWFNGLHPSAKHALRLSLPRNWMHRRFWLNDPDCLTVRDTDSTVVPGTLTLEEARFLATGIALSGGLTVLSDDLATLSPERREVALRVLPPAGRAARPVDLLARETPSGWTLPLGRGRHAVAVLNWDDAPMDATVTWAALGLSGPHHAREQWTGADLGRLDGALRLAGVPPHAARVVVLDPRRPPRRTRRLLPVR